MGLSVSASQGACYINGSSSRIWVYPSYTGNSSYPTHLHVSGQAFGYIDPGEMYIVPKQNFSPNYQLGVVEVIIYFPGWGTRTGYIEAGAPVSYPAPYWVVQQNPLHTIKTDYKLRYETSIYYGTNAKGTLPAGSTVKLYQSTTGASFPGRLYINGARLPDGTGRGGFNWMDIQLWRGSLSYNRNLY